jgi:hypothetical protein
MWPVPVTNKRAWRHVGRAPEKINVFSVLIPEHHLVNDIAGFV